MLSFVNISQMVSVIERFVCSAHPVMVLYICEKFHENISNVFQLTELTQVHGRNGYVQCSEGNNSRSRQTRVKVRKFCTSFSGALNLCEVLSKYLKRFPTHGTDTNTCIFTVFKGP